MTQNNLISKAISYNLLLTFKFQTRKKNRLINKQIDTLI